jgi:arabinose-5-phosphate isomerase
LSRKNTLEIESQGIQLLMDRFNRPQPNPKLFWRGCRAAYVNGRIVVSGIGKSGHIARKISATFAATWFSCIFVHPAEASHGGLGDGAIFRMYLLPYLIREKPPNF